ncbi:MAG: RidA family protein [Phycisphaerales bacterium]
MTPEARLAALGITLPVPAAPVAAYVPTRRSGNHLYVSGQLPFAAGKLMQTGPVRAGQPIEELQALTRQAALNGLAAAKAALGSLDRIAGVIRVGIWIACTPDFHDQPKVANGASELLVQVFGESGRHARAAVGTNVLPLNATVEVELLLEIGE